MDILKMTKLRCILMLGCLTCSVEKAVGNYIMPTVTLESCMSVTAHFRVDNMTSGGLIYIRTYQASHVLSTVDGTMYYACHFDDCDLNYNVKFTLIIQQKVVIQSNNDLHQTFICMKDISPALSVVSRGTDSDTSNLTRVTYNPEAAMTFSSDGQSLPGGSIVKLGRMIDISIALTNNIDDMFDISIRYCTMSTITLTDAYCPVHEDIFTAFTKLATGNFTNRFEMFRPTTTLGSTLNVIFTCVLELCMGECTQGCAISRRRRDDDSVLLNDGREVNDDNLYVGQMFTVVTQEEVEKVDKPTDRQFCLPFIALVVIFGVLGIMLSAAIGICSYVCISYLRHKPSTTNDINEGMGDQASISKEHPKICQQSSCDSTDGDPETSDNLSATNSLEAGTNITQSIHIQESNSKITQDVPKSPPTVKHGIDKHVFENDQCQIQVLYTNKPRRRSRTIEIPLIHMQNLISKIVPKTGAADGVIIYRGIKHGEKHSQEKQMSPVITVQ